ncbi:MAG TPA: cyclic nucleotide-binding domain-containing protein [Streptosporangiaceae bacterium]|nr:cyclic nucleotide-binding domain-containing protein [Streptosporangiaceae bacterium]
MSRVLVPPPEMRAAAPELIDAAEPVYVAETEAEREAVFSFRYSVYGAELGRKLGNADHGRYRVHDDEDDKPYTILLYTDDGAGQLTSTARLRHWEPGQVPAKEWEAFSMERFDGLDQMSTSEIGRLMIEPGRRGQLGLVSIVCAVYQLYAGEMPADVGFINCAAGLVRHYRLLGFRTYDGRLVSTADGIEVPLVVIPSDRAYLEQVGSFVAPFADVFYGPGKRAPVDVGRWARLLDADSAPVRFDTSAVWDRVSRLRQAETERVSMIEALSEDTVRKLSDKGFLMNVSSGQLLTEKGLTQREIFVILDGAFEVHDGDRRIALLGPGEVIGEVGFFGTSGRRMASVTAASDGQVLALRRRFVDEIMKSDPACAAEILFGLARVLADRQYVWVS